ncbi:hypothetical protein OR571_15725 [Psychrobacillus sp. NEAU-3TGS]|uniref:hypothetical protein n=1 Tax=Psychrobacillus sp. NEAU-3TGS TaxID=2995412 RepID=UPI002497F184|nr:hypothetical protein [Psychrobacillus sp. NEAU-3TGS]MDI2588523.1 hypothetical protein [Psychrobacillus sp. NEAU-3TGS]
MFVLIILGISILVTVFGVVYDYLVRKSFTEANRGPANQNDGRVKVDVATNQAVNTMNMPQ